MRTTLQIDRRLRPSRMLPSVVVVAVAVVVAASCSSDGRELSDPTEPLPTPTTSTTSTIAPVAGQASTASSTSPSTPTAAIESTELSPTSTSGTIRIDQLHSPANATAEMVGSGASTSDPVTVDDEPADVLSFRAADGGMFVLQVWIEEEGAHTVCVADACGRVYTLAPDAETTAEVVAKIEAALPLAQEYLDYPTVFPDWTVEIGGALAGTGGTTDVETKTVTIYRNRGRTTSDFVRSILHEFGHVTDFELLDDDDRAAYRSLRGVDPGVAWRDEGAHGVDVWGRQPSEDFAEVMVMIWSSGEWTPRTEIAGEPTLDDLAVVLELVGPVAG